MYVVARSPSGRRGNLVFFSVGTQGRLSIPATLANPPVSMYNILMKKRWYVAWAIQIIEMLLAGLLASASNLVSAPLYAVLLWAGAPLAGLFTSCRAVRRGLNNYLAFLAPAPCLYLAHALLWGFIPQAGPGLVTAFLSLIGAAAGEVLNRRK